MALAVIPGTRVARGAGRGFAGFIRRRRPASKAPQPKPRPRQPARNPRSRAPGHERVVRPRAPQRPQAPTSPRVQRPSRPPPRTRPPQKAPTPRPPSKFRRLANNPLTRQVAGGAAFAAGWEVTMRGIDNFAPAPDLPPLLPPDGGGRGPHEHPWDVNGGGGDTDAWDEELYYDPATGQYYFMDESYGAAGAGDPYAEEGSEFWAEGGAGQAFGPEGAGFVDEEGTPTGIGVGIGVLLIGGLLWAFSKRK